MVLDPKILLSDKQAKLDWLMLTRRKFLGVAGPALAASESSGIK